MTTQTIQYDKPSFLHWEGHPTNSRTRVKAAKAVKAGEVLVLTDKGYEPYKGTTLPTIPASAVPGAVVAFALADADKDAQVPCIIRNATVLIDKLVGVAADAFDDTKPLHPLVAHCNAQGIALNTSIATQRGFE